MTLVTSDLNAVINKYIWDIAVVESNCYFQHDTQSFDDTTKPRDKPKLLTSIEIDDHICNILNFPREGLY